MTLSGLLLKGWLIGFSVAMPVGPIGLLCIRNSLTYGMVCGLVCGLGAAFADTLYGAIASFGMSAASNFLLDYRLTLEFAGALFLCYLGLVTFFATPSKEAIALEGNSLLHFFLTTFFLTLTNPMTVLAFAGLYVGLGIGSEGFEVWEAWIVTLSVFVGSATWWLLLSFISSLFKEKINQKTALWLNRISGMMIFFCGLAALLFSFLKTY